MKEIKMYLKMLTQSEKEVLQSVVAQLKKIREKLNRSQIKVYDDTGIHIARIESGHENIMLTTLLQLCNYYWVKHIEITEHSIVINHVLPENEIKITQVENNKDECSKLPQIHKFYKSQA